MPTKDELSNDATVKELISEAIEREVSGLKNKTSELLGKNKELAESLKKFDGIDPDQVKAVMSKFQSKEEADLIAQGKMDEVIEKRIERQRQESAKQLQQADERVKAADERARKYEQRVLDNHIRAAAAKAGLHPHAIEDALFRARNIFVLNEEGAAVKLGPDGQPVFGKDGKTAFTPAEWLDSMKESAPHWFPSGASGGGAAGSGGAGYGGRDLSKLPPVERMNAARQMKRS